MTNILDEDQKYDDALTFSDWCTLDLLNLDSQFSPAEKLWRQEVSSFAAERIRPHIASWFEDAYFPVELVPEMGQLGLLGTHLSGYGCPGRSAVEYGLAVTELEAADSGIRTLVSVQGSLSMTAIHRFGTEEQKDEYLPKMAAGELIGSFGLTEPTAGSDPSEMTTFARRDGDDWVISGAKRWIGLANLAHVMVLWAKAEDDVQGFLVPTDSPGFTANPITAKLSMRISVQCDVEFDEVRIPDSCRLPGAKGLRAALSCLNEARYGIVWGAMGAARDSVEAALQYANDRIQFGRPISAFQLTQEKLVNMALELQKGQLLALHLGRLKDQGQLLPAQVSFGKLNNCRHAIEICRTARTILGGNGITLENSPLRHANNLESVRTYEGTDEVHTLILGKELTGHNAFS